MWAKPKQATSATTAILYITVGALVDVWSVIYYLWLNYSEASQLSYLICYGFFFSGLTLVIIGLAVGKIGQSARAAEVTPAPVATTQPAPAPSPPPAPQPSTAPASPGVAVQPTANTAPAAPPGGTVITASR